MLKAKSTAAVITERFIAGSNLIALIRPASTPAAHERISRAKEPAEFPVGGVIAGWTEALQLMNVGTKCQLFIPSDLAYGPRGAGADIGPNSTLVFEIELLDIVNPAGGRP